MYVSTAVLTVSMQYQTFLFSFFFDDVVAQACTLISYMDGILVVLLVRPGTYRVQYGWYVRTSNYDRTRVTTLHTNMTSHIRT
jgi:hypothetical protein